MTPALVMAPLGQAVLGKHNSRDMVKPGFPGPAQPCCPGRKRGPGVRGKAELVPRRIPAVIPPAPLAVRGAAALQGLSLHPERDWGASWALGSPWDQEWGPSAAPPLCKELLCPRCCRALL